MKIFSSLDLKLWDAATTEEQNISSHDLMERAAHACCSWIKNHFSEKENFYIFCGNGNNGGDGLALTRLLIENAYHAKAVLLQPDKNFSEDASKNLALLKEYSPQNILSADALQTDNLPENSIIVDAIFGTGLNRNIEGIAAELIEKLNKISRKKIAVDIPSGLFTDALPNGDSIVFYADYTLSFQSYKRSFMHPESAVYAGNIDITDIGLSKTFSEKLNVVFNATDRKLIKSFYKKRNPFSHKGTFGTAVIVGGSYGKIGAAALSGKAALRSGAGKVFIQSAECGYETIQSFIPEAMFEAGGKNCIEKITDVENAVFGIGPGFGTDKASAKALKNFLDDHHEPIVADADALNLISENPEWLPLLPKHSVITPHPKEFERLFGKTASTLEQTDLALAKAKEYGIVIVLKGHRTAVCTPDGKCFYNLTGNAGMATAGSGDVLTGIITGLLAQKYAPEEAALLGVYLHGSAGDIAAEDISQESLIAGDIIGFLGSAFIHLQHSTPEH